MSGWTRNVDPPEHAAALSYLGMRAVGNVIEGRLVRERAANAARVVSEMRLPLSPLMMQRLSEIFGEEDEGALAAGLGADAPRTVWLLL